jgi:hypothetical protein
MVALLLVFFKKVNLFKKSFSNRKMNFFKEDFSKIMISTKLNMTQDKFIPY